SHKGLEANHTAFGEGGQGVEIAGDDAAPESEVSDRRVFHRGQFLIEFPGTDGARRGIQRHVEEHSCAASGEGPASCGRAFPFSAAGLVEMNVNIDDAGKDGETSGIDFARGAGKIRANGADASVFDSDVNGDHVLRRDHFAAAHYKVSQGDSPTVRENAFRR